MGHWIFEYWKATSKGSNSSLCTNSTTEQFDETWDDVEPLRHRLLLNKTKRFFVKQLLPPSPTYSIRLNLWQRSKFVLHDIIRLDLTFMIFNMVNFKTATNRRTCLLLSCICACPNLVTGINVSPQKILPQNSSILLSLINFQFCGHCKLANLQCPQNWKLINDTT